MNFELTGLPAFLFILALLFVFFYLPLHFIVKGLAHVKRRTDKMRLLQQNLVVAEYEPPHGLSPAELGYLYDSKLNISEFYATIVNLEQRNLVTLDNATVVQVAETPIIISKFDAHVLDFLRKNTGKKLTKFSMRNAITAGDLIMNTHLTEQGYLLSKRDQIKNSFMRLGFLVLFIIAFTAVSFRPSSSDGIFAFTFFTIFFLPVYIVIAIFLYVAATKITGQPWLGGPKLKAAWPDIEGFKQYVELVELDRLKFDTKETEGAIKNKAHPYAIALGMDTGWQDKFFS